MSSVELEILRLILFNFELRLIVKISALSVVIVDHAILLILLCYMILL